MKKQILMLITALISLTPLGSRCHHGGGAIAGGVFGGLAIGAIAASAAHDNRDRQRRYDEDEYAYRRQLEEENRELQEELAEQRAEEQYREDVTINEEQPHIKKIVKKAPRKAPIEKREIEIKDE